MIEITGLRVQSFDIDHLDILWGFAPTTEDLGRFSITISRSESPGGPFEDLATVTDVTLFRDVNINNLHNWRTYYYKLLVHDLESGAERTFGPEWLRSRPSLEALEISGLFRLVLREHIGRRVWVFKRRTSGQRCPACYDADLQRRTSSMCKVCFDTGVVGGYWAPIEVDAQIDAPMKSTQLSTMSETQEQVIAARFPNFPLLDPRDVVVEAENIRWRVVSVASTERLRSVVHQEVQLHRIPPSDVEYELPLALALPVEASPERVFTERQTP